MATGVGTTGTASDPRIAQITALGKEKTDITLTLALVSAQQGVDNAVSGGAQGVAQKT
jgi:hypothetical protein